MAKDWWDKVEISGKFLGAVLIPAAVAISVYSLNSTASERATAAQMAGIAVGILMEDSSDKPSSGDALRVWAVDVLQNPGQVTPLGTDAAKQLYFEGLPTFFPGMLEAASMTPKFEILPELRPEPRPEQSPE
ncbi:hypothetical protein [Tritonibacter mobilis]|uniref:hypothetical protein n=1 Tax=Tritonibacter mobilis TaxID=379347 RepID=UPI001C08EDBE|nr:hypothetical protein [Tritonibacter mobilis]MBU3033633.1 hypothetical protein [Tritonibacter mobilis]WHQ84390.1 hypothetical protein OMR53_19760 [Tritonibacter mobilis]